jgi:quercetin dioxygenase-like cupin family protein
LFKNFLKATNKGIPISFTFFPIKIKNMKRNYFILSALAAAIAPWTAFSQSRRKMKRADRGFKINAGEGRLHGHIKLKGVNQNIIDIKISGKDTDGDLLLFEQTSLTQGRGVPLHIHPFQDEIFYVLQGEYYFQVGEDKYRLTVGDSIFLPRKLPHAWTQVSENGKLTVILQPAGKLEDFFITVAGLTHEPTAEEMKQIFADNEMRVVGPPLKIE